MCPPHAPTFMHMHTCIGTCITLKYTCIVITNGCLHGGIHVYHVKHACAYVHACMHMSACMWHSNTPTPHPNTHPPILFEDLCRLPHLWVGVWFCGLVDGWVFLLTFDCLLKLPQSITGLFWCILNGLYGRAYFYIVFNHVGNNTIPSCRYL